MAARITARFASSCAKCGAAIDAGAEIYYDRAAPKGRRAWHLQCPRAQQPEQAQPATDAAGLPEGVTYSRTTAGAHWYRCDSLQAAHALSNAPRAHNRATHASTDRKDSAGASWYGVATLDECRKPELVRV